MGVKLGLVSQENRVDLLRMMRRLCGTNRQEIVAVWKRQTMSDFIHYFCT
jgi:hypothetical protein